MKERIDQALSRIAVAIDTYDPIAVFGLFSGGHDSFSSCYVSSLHPKFTAAVHINTGIGIPTTRTYVRETCSERGWKLLEYKAVENTGRNGRHDPQIYAWLVRKYGFPGPFGHGMMYNRLKNRSLLRLERDFGATARKGKERRVMYISGCRTQESTRRMANTEEVQVDGRRIWVAPIHDWSKFDTSALLEIAGQPRNIVVDTIHKSGECLCGAFAKPGELEELNIWDHTRPAYDFIKKLESQVGPKFGWGWGERPLKKPDPNQLQLATGIASLCWSCEKSPPLTPKEKK